MSIRKPFLFVAALVLIFVGAFPLIRKAVLPHVISYLMSPQVRVFRDRSAPVEKRIDIAGSIGAFGGEQTVDILAPVLLDESEPLELRQAIAQELSQMEDFRAQKALQLQQKQAAGEKVAWTAAVPESVRGRIRRAFSKIAGEGPRKYQRMSSSELLEEARKLADQPEKSHERIAALIAALKKSGTDENLRGQAVAALGEISDPYLIEALIGALRDTDPSERKAVAMLLGRLKDTKATKALAAALSDADPEVFKAAKEALQQIYASRANLLVNYLAEADDLLRKYSSRAAKDLQDPAAFEVLSEGAVHPKASVRMKAWAVLSLEHTNNPALPELALKRLGDDSREVRMIVVGVLGKIGEGRAAAPLFKMLDEEEERLKKKGSAPGGLDMTFYHRLKGTLGVLREVPSDVIRSALKSQSAAVRGIAAKQMGASARPGDEEPLLRALCDVLAHPSSSYRMGKSLVSYYNYSEDLNLFLASLQALDPSRDRIVSLLPQWLSDPDESVRLGAVRAMELFRDERTTPALVAALKDGSAQVQLAAANALGEMKTMDAAEPLIAVLEGLRSGVIPSEPGSAETAAQFHEALVKITSSDFGEDPAAWRDWWERNRAYFEKDTPIKSTHSPG